MRTINKTTIYSVILLMAGISWSGCKKNFLDRNPYDQISNETFWASEQDALLALTGVYSHSTTYMEIGRASCRERV